MAMELDDFLKDKATEHDEMRKDKADMMTDDSLENVMINEATAVEKLVEDQNAKELETGNGNTGKWTVHMENEVKMVISKSKESGDKTHRDEDNIKDFRDRKRLKVNGKNTS